MHRQNKMWPLTGEAGRRLAIDAALAGMKASNNRPCRRGVRRGILQHFNTCASEDSARSSTWLALGQSHQVGDFHAWEYSLDGVLTSTKTEACAIAAYPTDYQERALSFLTRNLPSKKGAGLQACG